MPRELKERDVQLAEEAFFSIFTESLRDSVSKLVPPEKKSDWARTLYLFKWIPLLDSVEPDAAIIACDGSIAESSFSGRIVAWVAWAVAHIYAKDGEVTSIPQVAVSIYYALKGRSFFMKALELETLTKAIDSATTEFKQVFAVFDGSLYLTFFHYPPAAPRVEGITAEQRELSISPEQLTNEALTEPVGTTLGEIGHFGLFWFKDGIKYSYDMSTHWWNQFAELAGEYDEEAERPREIPDDVKRKSDRELADELVAFVQKAFPEELDRMSAVTKRLFWESKGLPPYLDVEDPKITLKVEKAESLAQLKLKQEVQKKEKQLVPKLVEECLNWAKENRLKKVTKTSVDYFLSEKSQILSKMSRDAIYIKVNFMLAK